MTSAATLARLERQLRRGMADGSSIVETPGFEVFIWPEADLFYRDRALPTGAEAAEPVSIAAMIEAFTGHRRLPRAELFAERWPAVATGLERAGLRVTLRAPVLVLDRGPAPPETAAGLRLLPSNAPPAALAAFLAGARAAFRTASSSRDAAEVRQLEADLAAGRSMAACLERDGEPVAGATLIGLGDDAELAAVWTRPGLEGRGYARSVCRLLLAAFFTNGGSLVWLSAEGERSRRLYEGIGFRRVGTQLDYILPEAPSP